MTNFIAILMFITLTLLPLHAQQVGDRMFNPTVPNPAYALGQGPVVFIDEAHHNFHTLQGRYQGYAKLLAKDGYQVKSFKSIFNRKELRRGKILVISNALHKRNDYELGGVWALPTPSAFTTNEINVFRGWVKRGGSLFLIADHMPFPGAAAELAKAFGIEFSNGFAFSTLSDGPIVFNRQNKTLKRHTITEGQTASERIDSVVTFTGQAFRTSSEAIPLLVFSNNCISLIPDTAWQFTPSTPRVAIEGWFQGAVLEFGKGRIAVFGEAAMFTCQRGGPDQVLFGMCAPKAAQNQQFLLNIIHWLDGFL